MLVEYAATEMGFLDNYLDADPNHKSIRVNSITTYLFHVAQCILFCLPNSTKTKLISNGSLKTFYLRLGFTVIKDFATSTNFEEARSQFLYETGKSKADQKKTIGLQCLHTIPQRVTFLHDDRINFNIHKNVFRDLDGISKSEIFFRRNILMMRSRKK